MRNLVSLYYRPLVLLAMSVANASFGQAALADEVTVGRYSTLRATPTEAQVHLLAAIVTTSFPESVTRVPA